MLTTSGPSVPLLISAVDFLPVARFVNSNFFSGMGALSMLLAAIQKVFLQVQTGRAALHDTAAESSTQTTPTRAAGSNDRLLDDLHQLSGLRFFVRVQVVHEPQHLDRIFLER